MESQSVMSWKYSLKLWSGVENMASTDICRTTCGAGAPSITLKRIGSLRNPEIRFRRLENVSKCVKILKKRIFNSIEPLMVIPVYPREEPFAEKSFSSLRNLKKGFVGKCGSFTVSYETLGGFVIIHLEKLVLYETIESFV